VRQGIVAEQPVCSQCETPGQHFGRKCPKCGRRYWGGGLLRMLLGGGTGLKR
jgi:tRNA(Ile2) C34 agmatinyltransferase TiaS